jgi:hypothetical protein
MSQISATQIAQAAYSAGFRGTALTTAVAVALAESDGNPDAHNGVPPDNSYGLWQVNMLGDLGPDRRRQFGLSSNDQLFDPATNAKAAYAISDDGKSFEPWSTYTDGAYRSHLADAEKAAQAVTNDHGKVPGGPPPPPAHKPPPPTHKPQPPSGVHKGGGNGQPGNGKGFQVDPAALSTYARQAERVGTELMSIGQRAAQAVDGIADNSFGAVGKESGFTSALGEFATALRQQVGVLSTDADQLGRGTAQVAGNYENTDDSAARNIQSVLG